MVQRTGGDHLDVVASTGQAEGGLSRDGLRATEHVGTKPGRDERQLHLEAAYLRVLSDPDTNASVAARPADARVWHARARTALAHPGVAPRTGAPEQHT
jgi:hypothetical protein